MVISTFWLEKLKQYYAIKIKISLPNFSHNYKTLIKYSLSQS